MECFQTSSVGSSWAENKDLVCSSLKENQCLIFSAWNENKDLMISDSFFFSTCSLSNHSFIFSIFFTSSSSTRAMSQLSVWGQTKHKIRLNWYFQPQKWIFKGWKIFVGQWWQLFRVTWVSERLTDWMTNHLKCLICYSQLKKNEMKGAHFIILKIFITCWLFLQLSNLLFPLLIIDWYPANLRRRQIMFYNLW